MHVSNALVNVLQSFFLTFVIFILLINHKKQHRMTDQIQEKHIFIKIILEESMIWVVLTTLKGPFEGLRLNPKRLARVGEGAGSCIMLMKVPTKIELQGHVCVCVVCKSTKLKTERGFFQLFLGSAPFPCCRSSVRAPRCYKSNS